MAKIDEHAERTVCIVTERWDGIQKTALHIYVSILNHMEAGVYEAPWYDQKMSVIQSRKQDLIPHDQPVHEWDVVVTEPCPCALFLAMLDNQKVTPPLG